MDVASQLSPLERRGLRALAFAGDLYEPFVFSLFPDWLLQQFVTAGLAEQGASSRPSVGAIGFRLTDRGWDIVTSIWKRD